jgi:hypothetical protein
MEVEEGYRARLLGGQLFLVRYPFPQTPSRRLPHYSHSHPDAVPPLHPFLCGRRSIRRGGRERGVESRSGMCEEDKVRERVE